MLFPGIIIIRQHQIFIIYNRTMDPRTETESGTILDNGRDPFDDLIS